MPISLLFLFLILPQLSPQSVEEIYENTPKLLFQTNNTISSFLFQVSKDFLTNSFKDVIIYGTPTPETSHPSSLEIFISSTPINLSDSSTYQLKCLRLLEMNPCIFSFTQIPDPTLDLIPLYFDILCRSPNCAYSLKIYHISPVFLDFNQPEMFQALRESGEIFNFTIPDKTGFDRIVFQMFFKRDIPKNNETKVIFSRGNPFIFRSENRMMAVFDNKDQNLCFDCNITVFLSLERGLLVELEVFHYDIQTALVLNREYYDFIATQNLYNITINRKTIENSCILFRIRSLAGSEKTLFVNPGSLPDSISAFLYNSTNLDHLFEYENDIEICDKDLNISTDSLTIYLAVKANIAQSPFILQIQNYRDQKIAIKLGISEKSIIKSNSFKYFELEVFNTEASEGKIRVFLNKYNNDLNLYTRVCSNPCALITEEDLINKSQIVWFDEKTQDTNLEIQAKCPEDPKCYYQFAVKSKEKQGFFSLLIKRENSFIELIENRRHESHIETERQELYGISLINDLRNLERLSFIVSSDVEYEVFIANGTEEIDKNSQGLIGNARFPVSLDKKALNFNSERFFVKVTSEKSTFYWILAEVERETQENSSFFMKITEGSLFSGVLNSDFHELYLQYINIDNTPVEIELIMRNEQGKLRVFIIESPEIPTENHYLLKSQGGVITFLKTEAFLKKYNILIKPREGIDLSSNESSIDFDLTISTNRTLKLINKPGLLLEKVEFNRTKQFLIIITENVTEISVLIQIPSISLMKGLQIGIRPNNNEDNLVTALIRYSESEDIKLNQEILNRLCDNIIENCEFFLEIINLEPDSLIFSLNVVFQAYSIEIKDSLEQKILFNSTGNQVLRLFYYIYNKTQPVEVSLRSYYPDFQVFFDIFDDRKGVFRSTTVKFPDNSSYMLHSQYAKVHYTRISEQEISAKCWPRCILLITLEPNPDKIIRKSIENPAVWVLINGEFMELPSDGKPRAFSLKNLEFRYCFLSLQAILKGNNLPKNGSISFSLTHFMGEGGIYFKASDDETLPFPGDFEFFAYDGHMTIYFKDLENFINKMSLSLVKIWLLVFCRSQDCEFALTSHVSHDDYQQIQLETPLELMMKIETIKYFRFKNIASTGFKIKFNRVSGIGRLRYGFCEENREFFEIKKCFKKNNESPSVFFAGFGESHITVRRTEPDYCEFCDIAISLESLGDLKGTLSVVDLEDFAYLLEGKTYYDSLESLETNKYRIMVSKIRETTIKVSKFNGLVDVYLNSFYEVETKKYEKSLTYDKEGVMLYTIPAEMTNNTLDIEVLKPIFIAVKSQGPANYSIMFTTSQMLEMLNYGLLEKSIIPNNTKKGYFFQTFDKNLEKSLTVMVSDAKNLLIGFRWKASDAKDFDYLPLTEQIITENSYLFSLPKEKVGTYCLDLKNLDNISNISISIILNSIDAVLLPLDLTIHGILAYKSYKYYEVFLENPGYLVLDFKECTGFFELAYTKDYKNLFLHEFDGTFTPVTRSSGLSRLKLDRGMIYFAIQAVNKDLKGSLFELTALYFDGFYEIPESQMAPGEEGRLRVAIRNKERQSIWFWPVKCEEFCEDDEMKEARVEYIASFSEKQGGNKCGGDQSIKEKVKSMTLLESNQANKELNFEINEKKGSFFVGLRAIIQNYRNSSRNFSIYYQELDLSLGNVNLKSSTGAENYYFFIVCFGGLIGLMCCYCGMQYWRKCLKGEQTLTYEMQDVRNVAQIRGVNETMGSDNDGGVEIENQGKSYVGLVEE